MAFYYLSDETGYFSFFFFSFFFFSGISPDRTYVRRSGIVFFFFFSGSVQSVELEVKVGSLMVGEKEVRVVLST